MVKLKNTDGITFDAIGWGEISVSLWWMNETHLDGNL
jgi:hypothetical protein